MVVPGFSPASSRALSIEVLARLRSHRNIAAIAPANAATAIRVLRMTWIHSPSSMTSSDAKLLHRSKYYIGETVGTQPAATCQLEYYRHERENDSLNFRPSE